MIMAHYQKIAMVEGEGDTPMTKNLRVHYEVDLVEANIIEESEWLRIKNQDVRGITMS